MSRIRRMSTSYDKLIEGREGLNEGREGLDSHSIVLWLVGSYHESRSRVVSAPTSFSSTRIITKFARALEAIFYILSLTCP
jgi:hypothetical protein